MAFETNLEVMMIAFCFFDDTFVTGKSSLMVLGIVVLVYRSIGNCGIFKLIILRCKQKTAKHY